MAVGSTSVQKADVRAEVEVAAAIRERGGRKPLIIPVRVRFTDVLDIPLLMRLQHLQAWSWNDERDTLGLASWILAGKRDPGAQAVGRPANLRLVRQIRAGAVGLPMRILGARGVAAVAVVVDGSRAVSAIDTTVRVWDARYGAELFQLGPFQKGYIA